ncbi:EamA family transporter [Flindersiella endophytica]
MEDEPVQSRRTIRLPGQESQAVLMLLASSTSLQFGAAFAVILLHDIGPIGAASLRIVFAAVILLVFVRPKLAGRRRSDLAFGAMLGLVLATMNICYYAAAARVPLGAAVTLEFIGPLGLAVVTSRRLRDVVWVVFAAAGVLLLSEGGVERLDPVGVAFGFAAGACWVCYILLGARVGRAFPAGQGLAVAMLTGSIAVLPLTAATATAELFEPRVLLLGLTVAAMSSALPYTLELAALRRIPARTFGVLMSLQPAVAVVAGFLILHQRLTVWQLVAIGLVIVASAGATRSARPEPATP